MSHMYVIEVSNLHFILYNLSKGSQFWLTCIYIRLFNYKSCRRTKNVCTCWRENEILVSAEERLGNNSVEESLPDNTQTGNPRLIWKYRSEWENCSPDSWLTITTFCFLTMPTCSGEVELLYIASPQATLTQ